MHIRIEICEGGEEEIIIRCHKQTEQIKTIETMLEDTLSAKRTLSLHTSGVEYLIEIKDILFFETYDGKVYAHTKHKNFTAEYTLTELENLLPSCFVRVSRSCIVNIMSVTFIKRELVGNGTLGFVDTEKKAYFSRSYFKLMREKIDEMRLGK